MENSNAITEINNLQHGTVEFFGQPLTVITAGDQLLVAMRPICEGIGLDWKAQLDRIKRDEVLSEGMVVMTTPSPGGEQRTTCLPLELLNGWLFGVETKRCRLAIRPALTRYKRECYAALAAYWQERTAKAELAPSAPGMAFNAAAGLSAVQRFGLEQMMNTRLLLSFRADGGLDVKPVAPEALLITPDRLATVIGDNLVIGQQHLPEILFAVAGRMRCGA